MRCHICNKKMEPYEIEIHNGKIEPCFDCLSAVQQHEEEDEIERTIDELLCEEGDKDGCAYVIQNVES